MEIRALEYFLAVAREENMTEAANSLHITQPTLSRQIADLERDLGTKLFIRTNRNTLLTETGMRFRQRAEEILTLVNQTEREMYNDTLNLSGCIRIGAAESPAMHIVAEILAAMHQEHPDINFELSSGNADTIDERLTHGTIDVGVFLEPVNLEKYDYIRLPEQNQLGVLLSKKHPLASHDYISVQEFKELPLLYSSRSHDRLCSSKTWAPLADSANVVGRYDLIGNASHLVREGIANALCIDGLVLAEDSSSDLCFLPLYPFIPVSTVVVWKKYRLHTKILDLFIDKLKERC